MKPTIFKIDPTDYGLNKRINLYTDKQHNYIIEKIRKSRIIQKDALKIIEIGKTIIGKDEKAQLSLRCTPNICSKSIALLSENKIGVEYASPEDTNGL